MIGHPLARSRASTGAFTFRNTAGQISCRQQKSKKIILQKPNLSMEFIAP
jgi:hypothetical protein